MKSGFVAAGLVVLLAGFCGCERDDQQIKVYRIAKAPLESTPAPEAPMPTNASSPSALLPSGPASTAAADTPKNWEAQPLSQMRQASFLVRGANGATADISFVALGPAAGNLLDNVNRWLGQLRQPAVSEEKLKSMIQPLATSRGNIAVVDLAGEPENGDPSKDGRIIGAIASDDNGTAFFKMRGNKDLVGTEKENFLKWVAASRGATTSASTADATKPPMPAGPMAADRPQIKWQVPAGWTETPPSAMRYASFAAEQGGEKADISIVTFPGDGGGDLNNVNRWRQQIGLEPIDAKGLESMKTDVHAGDVHIDVVDMTGSSGRVLAAWLRQNGNAWFFKMTGPTALLEQEKPKFTAFLESLRF